MSSGIPVREAAGRLKVNPSRVRAMIYKGQLVAEKVGDRWLVEPASVERRSAQKPPAGRGLARQNAWAALSLASGASGRSITVGRKLSPFAQSRVRSRLRTADLTALVPRLRGRATVQRFRAHPSDLRRITEEKGVVRAGASAAADYDVDIAAPGTLEAYVSAERLTKLQRKYGFEPSASPNLVLHVVDDVWPFASSAKVAPAAVVALDLIESDDQRSRRAGEALLKRLEAEVDRPR